MPHAARLASASDVPVTARRVPMPRVVVAGRVSVCIPSVTDRAALLAEAVRSVHQQNYGDVECVVECRDRRPDDTAAVVADKINAAVQASSGEYVCVLCDDDKLSQSYVSRCVAVLQERKADLVYTDTLGFGEKVSQLSGAGMKIALPDFDSEVLRMKTAHWMTFVCTRDLWEAVAEQNAGRGAMDRGQEYIDWDFGISAWSVGAKVVHLRGEYLYHWRDHHGNGSRAMDGGVALRKLRDKWPVWNMPDSEESASVAMAMQTATPERRLKAMHAALAALAG